jgi:ankyrin repeat protein
MKRPPLINQLVIFLSFATLVLASRSLTAREIERPPTLADLSESSDWDALKIALAQLENSSLTAAERDRLLLPQPDGMTALHWTAFHDMPKILGRLLDQPVMATAMDAKTAYGITPLSIACTYGLADVASCLLKHNAKTDLKLPGETTLLMLAARHGNVDCVSKLLAAACSVDDVDTRRQTALMWAAERGNTAACQTLLEAGAEVDQVSAMQFTPLMFAARQGKIETTRLLLARGATVNQVMDPPRSGERKPRRGMSALMFAVESGHFELALELIEAGADPNDQRSGFAPLHAISWVRKTNRGDDVSGDPPPRGSGSVHVFDFVRGIVKSGADVNLKTLSGSGGKAKLHMQGVTPFLLAARTADLPLMQLLVELGANPNLCNKDGCNALMAAAGVGVVAVGEEAGTEEEVVAAIGYLLSQDLDPNATDANRETAMHGAAYRNFPKAVAALAQGGAEARSWDRKNRHGWTPIMIAQGQRPGSFKPSPETVAALQAVRE